MTGSVRAKYKSGLGQGWCAAHVPLVLSFGDVGFANSFLMSQERLLALVLIHLLVVFSVSAAAWEVICALSEVVNSSFVRPNLKYQI